MKGKSVNRSHKYIKYEKNSRNKRYIPGKNLYKLLCVSNL
jgi:hypothetical protein